MNPSIAGSAELFVGFAVGVGEMEGVSDADQSVVFRGRRSDCKFARLALELLTAAVRGIAPPPLRFGHEADAIIPIAVVEPGHLDEGAIRLVASELGRKGNVEERVAVRGAFQGKFKGSPLLD